MQNLWVYLSVSLSGFCSLCLFSAGEEGAGGGGVGGQISDTAPVRTDAANAQFFTTCHEHQSTLGNAGILRHPSLNEGLHCHEQQPPLETTHKGVNQRSKDVTQTQQQKPESPTVTLAWHASKYEAHKLHLTSEAQAFGDTGISNAGISRPRNLERRHSETPESRTQAFRDTEISNARISRHQESRTQAYRDTGISMPSLVANLKRRNFALTIIYTHQCEVAGDGRARYVRHKAETRFRFQAPMLLPGGDAETPSFHRCIIQDLAFVGSPTKSPGDLCVCFCRVGGGGGRGGCACVWGGGGGGWRGGC